MLIKFRGTSKRQKKHQQVLQKCSKLFFQLQLWKKAVAMIYRLHPATFSWAVKMHNLDSRYFFRLQQFNMVNCTTAFEYNGQSVKGCSHEPTPSATNPSKLDSISILGQVLISFGFDTGQLATCHWQLPSVYHNPPKTACWLYSEVSMFLVPTIYTRWYERLHSQSTLLSYSKDIFSTPVS